MVTFAQAQERGERWVNGGVPAHRHRDVRVREFDLGFVVWAEDREDGPAPDGGRARLVIARDSGEATLWPDLPAGEVIRRYEEEYGTAGGNGAAMAGAPPKRIDLEATSFLLTPPQWLQEAADQRGIPGRRSGSATQDRPPSGGAPEPPSAADGGPEPGTGGGGGGGIAARDVPPDAPPQPPDTPGAQGSVPAPPAPPPGGAKPETPPAPGNSAPSTPPESSVTTEPVSPLPANGSSDPGGPPIPGTPQPPGVPAPPGQPGAVVINPPHPHDMPGAPQPPAGPGTPPGTYGYPQPPAGLPMVGPGYMAVLRYRAHDGSEQQLIRRSAPGTPHPEWQIFHELRALGVPPQQVVELHTELEPCELPGGYCARMIRESWPQVRLSHTASYGRDHATRRQGVRHLVEHQGELHQVADGPARPAPNRVPLPHPDQVQRVPPVPVDGVAHELLQSFGPHGVFRFDQRAVARQGVPEAVAQTLVWAGLPVDFGPFFWAQAQPGRPVPTLAELAAERQVQPASDANSYLVMGSDFGRQLCVQYGTAHIVAVPLEAGPGGGPVPPQFVNTGLPEFVRCMALLGRMWRLRYGLTPEQAGRWTVDFQAQLAELDPAALSSPENWWAVLLEQMWDGLL